jgi:hypothetical protein
MVDRGQHRAGARPQHISTTQTDGFSDVSPNSAVLPLSVVQSPATGDFFGDGLSDILLQNADGNVGIWEMNGFNIIAAGNPQNPGTSWQAIGTGDFNADGKSDIPFQNISGQVGVWEMASTSPIAARAAEPRRGGTSSPEAPAGAEGSVPGDESIEPTAE